MSTQAHTPTPWHATACGRIEGSNFHRIASAYHYKSSVIRPAMEANAENEANAAHIVKCVNERDDLVSALEEALEFIERHIGVDVVDGDYGEPKPDRAMQVATMLRATLAKVHA